MTEARRLRAAHGWQGWPARLRNGLARQRGEADFSHAVKEAMDGCLACKSCAGGCPVKVNVPSFRAKFLELYHGRYPRPLRDHLVAALERTLPLAARLPRLHNALLGCGPGRAVLRSLGLVDTPALSGIDLGTALRARGLRLATPDALRALPEDERARAVVLVQDAFTSHYETPLVLDVLDLMVALGARPFLAPFRPNGKAQHVHGLLGRFARTAAANASVLRALAATGVPLVGVDPSVTLTYRAEYPEAGVTAPPVLLLQEWLVRQPATAPPATPAQPAFRLLAHCTERTTATSSLRDWQAAFARQGLALEVLAAGCCGMAGTFGHEAEHKVMSEHAYGLSWRRHVAENSERLLATGCSCRSQVKRFDNRVLRHPAQALLAVMRERGRPAGGDAVQAPT